MSFNTAQRKPPHMRAKRICRQRTNCTTPAHVMTPLMIDHDDSDECGNSNAAVCGVFGYEGQ